MVAASNSMESVEESNAKLHFCRRFVFLDRRLISFGGRPYLPAVYESNRNLVLRCSRQVEKSTFLVNTILYEACTRPGIKILFAAPRREQALVFSNTRLLAALDGSPLIRRQLLGRRGRKPSVTNMQFANGSEVYVRAAYHSGDACRGLSADLLLVDEFQDIAPGDLPTLQETMSHAKNPRTILTGTPKSIDNHLEGMFRHSTANEWLVPCACGKAVALDEHTVGPTGIVCPACSAVLDAGTGGWVPRNPHARWGDGFCINHLMVPWLNHDDILERQTTYDIAKFKNEVLGLPTTAGDQIVSRAELEACCEDRSMANGLTDVPAAARGPLVAGVDWGGGGNSQTVLVIGYMQTDFRFKVLRLERFRSSEDPNYVLTAVASRCSEFRVSFLAADGGGNGHVLNRLLVDQLNRLGSSIPLYAILYSAVDQPPRIDGVLTKWTVGRSPSIGVLFGRIKKKSILFPRASDCGTYLDEFECERADYDEINRTIKYTHPETQQDDALHATNYALLIATRSHHVANGYLG